MGCSVGQEAKLCSLLGSENPGTKTWCPKHERASCTLTTVEEAMLALRCSANQHGTFCILPRDRKHLRHVEIDLADQQGWHLIRLSHCSLLRYLEISFTRLLVTACNLI